MTTQRHLARQSAWQSIDSGQLLLVAAAGVLLVAAVAQTAAAGLVQPRDALAFGALIALGELLRLSLPGDREAAPIGSAGALGYALAIRVGMLPRPAARPAGGRGHRGRDDRRGAAAPGRRAARRGGRDGFPAAGGGVRGHRLPAPGHLAVIDRHVWLRLAVMAVLIVAGWLAECVIKALIRADALRARFIVSLGDELGIQVPLGAAVGASAMLIALATEAMGLVALALLIAPLLVTQTAFRRYAGIRSTYLQTVRALARVTEVGGYVEDGHSYRVGRLAVAVGRELGMSEPDLLELEYAALMHDIGQLSLADPIPGGATVLASPADQQRIAGLGASVIEQAGVLDGVAQIVRGQCQPWRGSDPEPPIGSRIIRAANAFDDLVGGSPDRDRSTAALERLRLDTASEYDPGVVEALTKVTGRYYPGRL